MEILFLDRGVLHIDDARIIFKNFSGAPTKFNPRGGERGFSLIIPNDEIAERLIEEGWNVKIREPREEGEEPLRHLPVKISFNEYGPKVHLVVNNNRVKLDEESVDMLDDIVIGRVDMDLRPYDWEVNGNTGRSAYLSGIRVFQVITDRFETDEF